MTWEHRQREDSEEMHRRRRCVAAYLLSRGSLDEGQASHSHILHHSSPLHVLQLRATSGAGSVSVERDYQIAV